MNYKIYQNMDTQQSIQININDFYEFRSTLKLFEEFKENLSKSAMHLLSDFI